VVWVIALVSSPDDILAAHKHISTLVLNFHNSQPGALQGGFGNKRKWFHRALPRSRERSCHLQLPFADGMEMKGSATHGTRVRCHQSPYLHCPASRPHLAVSLWHCGKLGLFLLLH